MRTFKKSHLLVALLAVLLLGYFTLDIASNNEASVVSLPDFTSNTQVDPAESKPVGTLKDFNDAIVNIASETRQAVVSIEVTQTVEAPQTPLSRFFDVPEGEFQRRGIGSGVIVSQDGYILTNNHVIDGASTLEVRLPDGSVHEAEIIGTDPRTDIAVVKIDAQNLTALSFGDSDEARVGEMVLAIGSPLDQNLAQSVSMGIISAKNRAIGILRNNAGYENFIQTDAAINPGNSGGALVNMDGQLIGVNSAIASRSGGNDGIGFAVPSNLARSVMESLIQSGEVRRAHLGIQRGGVVDAAMAKALGLENTRGVIVGNVTEGGPADKAGLQEGDVIVSLNGEPVQNWTRFRTSIATSEPGTEVTLGINRGGESMDVEVTLDELPEDLRASSSPDRQQQQPDLQERLGFGITNLTADLARRLGMDTGTEGVVVTEVRQNSRSYRQGLRQGDVITHVDRKRVSGVSEFSEQMEQAMESDRDVVLLQVLRRVEGQDEPAVQYIAIEL